MEILMELGSLVPILLFIIAPLKMIVCTSAWKITRDPDSPPKCPDHGKVMREVNEDECK